MTAQKLIDIISPEHDRTSCSDDNLENGLSSYDGELTLRCSRCMLLEIMNERWQPVNDCHDYCGPKLSEDFAVNITIQ